jgi:AcrR family transcriptional regulator
MARPIPENRFEQLIEAATGEFIDQGYRRTQIADVARAMGVAKGTVYRYVASKEALFAAALRHADARAPLVSELELPLATPSPAAIARELEERLSAETIPDALARALSGREARPVQRELDEIVRGLFAVSSRHRTAIKLIDRCGRDHPELSSIFYRRGRFAQLDALTRYLSARVESGAIPALPDVAVAARFVIEAVATWAVHIHWDPAPQPISMADAQETLVRILVTGLLHHKNGEPS